jgi:hypothetical protein
VVDPLEIPAARRRGGGGGGEKLQGFAKPVQHYGGGGGQNSALENAAETVFWSGAPQIALEDVTGDALTCLSIFSIGLAVRVVCDFSPRAQSSKISDLKAEAHRQCHAGRCCNQSDSMMSPLPSVFRFHFVTNIG